MTHRVASDSPATRLRAAMARAGITRAELARRLGVNPATVANVLNGSRNPTLDWLHSAAIAAGIDPAELAPGVLASTKAGDPAPADH